jgi:phenylacetate-CoA ligase
MTIPESAIVHIFQPLYRLRRRGSRAGRAALRAFSEGMAFRRTVERWSDEQRDEWVLRRLRHVLRTAAAELPFHAVRMRAAGFDPAAPFGFKDFARLPVLERHELREQGESLILPGLPTKHVRRDSTGGSTGEPTVIWTGPEERGWRESGSAYFLGRLGLRRGMRQAMLWGHHLDPVASSRLADRLRTAIDNARWYDCLRLSPEVLRQYHRNLQQWRPRYIIAYASALATLAHEVEQTGEAPAYPTHALITGAEKLLPQQREQIERVFRRAVHERYGSRDVGLVAFQVGRTAHAYDIDWANLLVEPETDEPQSPILVTKLHADAMPLIRYRIGDIGRFPDGSRPGHPATQLHEVVGRDVDRIWLPERGWVHGLTFPHLFKDYPVAEFQVRQSLDYSVTVSLVIRQGFREDTADAIYRLLRANLKGVPLSIAIVDHIPRTASGKLRPVVSEVRFQVGRDRTHE